MAFCVMHAGHTGDDILLEPVVGDKVEEQFEGEEECHPVVADELRARLTCEGEADAPPPCNEGDWWVDLAAHLS